MIRTIFAITVLGILATFIAAQAQEPTEFEKVQEVLNKHCVGCHSGKRARDGVDLSSYENIMKGGRHGKIVVSDKLDKSVLALVLTGAGKKDQMPPRGKMSDDKIKIIKDWIKAGAKK